MKKLLLGLALLPFVAGTALAQEPSKLTGEQMDKVAAGFGSIFGFDCIGPSSSNANLIPVAATAPSPPPCVVIFGRSG